MIRHEARGHLVEVDENVLGSKVAEGKGSASIAQQQQLHLSHVADPDRPESSASNETERAAGSIPIARVGRPHLHQIHSQPISESPPSITSFHPSSSSVSSTHSRPSSAASNSSFGTSAAMPSRSSHSNLSASLLTPTLASALGIIPSARRRRRATKSQIVNSATTSMADSVLSSSSSSSLGQSMLPNWSRRPSLPSLDSNGVSIGVGDGRMSMYSVASFESLPEGEVLSTLSSSPRSANQLLPRDAVQSIAGALSSSHAPSSDQVDDSSESPRQRAEEKVEAESNPVWAKKRRNITMELLETERAYVASLRIINEHYYAPLLNLSRGIPLSTSGRSSTTAAPVLSRKAISEIFSNFADILHLNSELLIRLEDRLSGRNRDPPNSRPVSIVTEHESTGAGNESNPPRRVSFADGVNTVAFEQPLPWDAQDDRIGDLLAPLAPFLKMYSFYVKNFSSALARIDSECKASDSFARFVKETERITWMTGTAAGRPSASFGFGLGLQAHLLTIVQRIPRYKLLVGELVKCTPTTHKDHADLTRAYEVIKQVAESINDNIRQHEMVLSMLGIQKSMVGLTVPLIVPGRSLLKRATLLKAGRKDIHPREFFLFTDCIMYAAPVGNAMSDASAAWQAFSRYGSGSSTAADNGGNALSSPALGSSNMASRVASRSKSPEKRPVDGLSRKRTTSVPGQVDPKRVSFSVVMEGQQLQFRGKFALQDCTVVGIDDATSSDPALRHYFEIRTPGKSFAVYADSFEAQQDWLSSIRSARDEYMSNRRTLHAEEDSITAKRDRRVSLQVTGRQISFPRTSDSSPSSIPEGTQVNAFTDVRSRRESLPAMRSTSIVSFLGNANTSFESTSSVSASTNGLRVLEEYNAPVWVPDSRADRCARCNEGFGLWRRKHHCRLCGQVVCWACSQRSFLIASYEEGEQDRPARACDTCYESVFPAEDHAHQATVEDANALTSGSEATPNSRLSQALESDASLPSCPPTPTSPQPSCIEAEDPKRTSVVSLTAVTTGHPDEHLALYSSSSPSAPPVSSNKPRDGSVSPSVRQAPAARIAKAHIAEAQLFSGRLLSPQVHAATSGTGTFRLVTPRLTTPENEHPPNVRAARSYERRIGLPFASSALSQMPMQAGDEESMRKSTGEENPGQPYRARHSVPFLHLEAHREDDYFAGAQLGRSELVDSTSLHPFPSATPLSSASAGAPLMPRRRKPMSAAARLSSVYSAFPPQSPSTT